MRLNHCFNYHDFRELARRRLPAPIFNYIDGAADDETTYRRNTAAFEECDLLPNVLSGVEHVDLSVVVMGQKLEVPFYCSPTALQRLFHHQGERAVAQAVQKFGTMFGVSSLGTVSLEEISSNFSFPQVYQFYFHKDRGLNKAMLERAQAAGVHIMMLTVDSITGGNRERDLRTGFSIPFQLDSGRHDPICLEAEMGNRLRYSREIPVAAIGTARRHVWRHNFDWRLLHKYARPVDELARCRRDGETLAR